MKCAKTPIKTLISFANWSPWSIPIFNSRIHVSKYRNVAKMPYNDKKNSITIIDVIDRPKTPM